jgi:hypothetical protein
LVWYPTIRDSGILTLQFVEKGRRGNYFTKLSTTNEVSAAYYEKLLKTNPAQIITTSKCRYIWVDSGFHEADVDLSLEEAAALVRAGEIKRSRKIQRALEMTQGGAGSVRINRSSIPDDVKHFIWMRDGARCVSCGSDSDLQYDHIIPLALGGSNEPGNLQLLCSTCNRQKGANLTVTPLPRGIASPKRLPTAQSLPIGSRGSVKQSYVPGPNLVFHPSSPKVEPAKIGGTRAHDIARTQMPLLGAKITQLHAEFREDIQTIQPLCKDLAAYCNEFDGIFVHVDKDGLTLGVNVKERRKSSRLNSKIGKFQECMRETAAAWSEFFQTDVKQILQNTEERLVKVRSIPPPESPDANRRVSEWAEALNGYLDDIKTSQDSLNIKKYRQLKIRLEDLASEIQKFCHKNLKAHNLSEREVELLSELSEVLEANRLLHATYEEGGGDERAPASEMNSPLPPSGPYWEYRYLVLEIEYQFAPLKTQIDEFLFGNIVPNPEPVVTPLIFVDDQLQGILRSLKDAEQHFNTGKLKEALGPKGEPGDAAKLKDFVTDQMSLISQVLRSANALREATVGPEWMPIYMAVANIPREMLANVIPAFRNFCADLTARIDHLETGAAIDSSNDIRLNWNANIAAEDKKALSIATELMKNRRELLRR